MKRLEIVMILMMTYTIHGYSQNDTTRGVAFSQNIGWREILEKAKVERKYVFVDCYATWCGPCKLMDKEVYLVDTVGNFMNDKFISVKIQMDTTRQDSKEIQQWYAEAREIEEKYSVRAYPTFLFFSPDGLIVHKEIGDRDANEFLEAAVAALSPHTSYYTLLSNYKHGSLTYPDEANFASTVYKLGQDSLAFNVAKDYIHRYLNSLSEGFVWNKEMLNFIIDFRSLINYNDLIFQLFFHDRKTIDSIMGKSDWADGLINDMVYRDDVAPKVDIALKEHHEPKWKEIKKSVERKYDYNYLNYGMYKGQMTYYKAKGDSESYAKFMVLYYENLGIRNMNVSISIAHLLNNKAYELCLLTDTKKYLQTALLWVNRAMEMEGEPDGNAFDTKGNILYKMGKRKEGLASEKKALFLRPQDKEIQESYRKMQEGLTSN